MNLMFVTLQYQGHSNATFYMRHLFDSKNLRSNEAKLTEKSEEKWKQSHRVLDFKTHEECGETY